MPKDPYGEFLKSKVGIFVEVKDAFGIEPNRLGFGCCPDSHHYPTDGMIVPLRNIGGAYYFLTSNDGLLECCGKRYLAVKPNDDRIYSYIVSIFHKNPFGKKSDFIQQLPNNSLAGLIAHECAEYLNLDEYEHDRCAYLKHQMKIDLCAKAKGFGDELIEFFRDKIERLEQDNGEAIILNDDKKKAINNGLYICELIKRIRMLEK